MQQRYLERPNHLQRRINLLTKPKEHSSEQLEELQQRIDKAKKFQQWIELVGKGFDMLAKISKGLQSNLILQFNRQLIPAHAVYHRIWKKIHKINDSKNMEQLQVIFSILSLRVKMVKELSLKRCTCNEQNIDSSCMKCQIFQQNNLPIIHLHKRMLFLYQAIQKKLGFRSEKVWAIMEFIFKKQPEINKLSDRTQKQVIIRSRRNNNYKSPLIH